MAWATSFFIYPIIRSATGACLSVMLWAMFFGLLSHDCVWFDVSPSSASEYYMSGLPPICVKAFLFRARRLGPLCVPLYWNGRDFLAECVHDQEPRYIVHRSLDLPFGTFSRCLRSSKKNMSVGNFSNGRLATQELNFAQALL